MAVVGGGLVVGSGYDLMVAQAASNPDKWPRFYDLMSFMPWWAWVIALLGMLVILMFEGGFRSSRSKDETILALRQEIADKQGTPPLPLELAVAPPESGNAGVYRFQVHNPTGVPVPDVYGKYRSYRAITRPGWRLRWLSKLPSDGMDLPWEGTSQTVGAHSSEYLLLGVQRSRSFRHFDPNKKLARYQNGGTYEFDLEIGSKTNGTPIFHHVQIAFSGLTDFDVEIIPPAPNTESEPPQPAPEAHP